MSTFVTVGNATQSFCRLINAVVNISAKLPQPVVVQHGHTPCYGPDIISKQFMEMSEFNHHISDANLLIMHAGAGSVINAVQSGKVPVVMPRSQKYGEHIDDHQLEFACALAELGSLVMIEEPDELITAVEEAMKKQIIGRELNITTTMVGFVSEALCNHANFLKGHFDHRLK